jgi:DNA-binding NtrC family response regulator
MKILIVDDDQAVAAVIQMMLEIEGYEVYTARNGQEGYLVYLGLRPDLVITDIRMPGETGFQLMDHIREHDPEVKTIYMSANGDEYYSLLKEEQNKYRSNFLDKPFTREALIGLVSRSLVH